MKIRIKGNSLRFRLTKTDVSVLAETGVLTETTAFADRELHYGLKATYDSNIGATYIDDIIAVSVPKADIDDWANSDRVGIAADLIFGEERSLSILIEKDFKCLDADVTEDQSDNFENPNQTC